jgi:predicted Zn-dependent peptidase
MRRAVTVCIGVVLLAASSVTAQQVKVREETLANGMKVLLVERHDSPTIACGWVAKVGSVNESPGITGISHLFEHMMFKGTKTIGTTDEAKDAEIIKQQDAVHAQMEHEYSLLREKLRRGEISGSIYDTANQTPRLAELRAQLEKLFAAEKAVIVKEELDQIYTRQGASSVNAGTTEDQTFYFVVVPANKLELWCWLESDRLLAPVFREFYSERDVVREERRLHLESTPTGKFEEAFDAMFWESSPYSHPVFGWPSDLEAITRAQAERYFGIYYAPNNITAALVGDFDSDRALAMMRTYFERIPRGTTPPPEMVTVEVPQPAEKRLVAEADTNPEVDIRYHTVGFLHRDRFALKLLADLLSRRTGRLYRLVEDQQVAVGEPYAYAEFRKYEGFLEVGAEVREGRRPQEVEEGLLGELEKLREKPVGEHELQKVKNQELADSFRRLRSNFFLMLQLLLYDSDGDWHFINEAPGKLQAVTAADIQAVAQKYLTKENRNVAVYLRKGGSAAEDPELAAIPAQMRGMVRQQVAEFERIDDKAKLEQVLARLQEMSTHAPPTMQKAVAYMVKKAQERLDALQAQAGGGSEKTPPPSPKHASGED